MNPGQIAYFPAGGRVAVQQPLLQPHATVNTVSQQTGKCVQPGIVHSTYINLIVTYRLN